jgi:hypothetical protein
VSRVMEVVVWAVILVIAALFVWFYTQSFPMD